MNEVERFEELKKETDALSDKKIRIEERFNNEKNRLEELITEIKEKGYDPKKLTETRKLKEEELKKLLEKLESQVKETKEKLNLIEV